jgi:methionyl-tRNA formyltransferase
MGTPDFAVESLRRLTESDHDIAGVITAPDKPAGRGKTLSGSPVKQFAIETGIPVILQPEKLKDPGFLENLKSLHADLQVVVAFRMLPEVVWAMPPKGTVNLHASLLPDYRGAAPINWALINGETETGVTTFFIEKDIDTGNIIDFARVNIEPDMNAGQLHDKLMHAGAELLVKTVNSIAAGDYKAKPQSESYTGKNLKEAPKIFKQDCRIDWSLTPKEIHDFVRGLSPYPAAWTVFTEDSREITVKVFQVEKENSVHNYQQGKLISDGQSYIKVAVKDGFISLINLQLAGKKRMPVAEFLRGFKSIENIQVK